MLRETSQGDKDVLSAEEAAEFLGFNPYTIREKARLGEIPGRKIGREWRFSRAVLLSFIEGRELPSGVAKAYLEMRETVHDLLVELHPYYWHADDPELEIVNKLRGMLGMRPQFPKCCEAELGADIAEGKVDPSKPMPHDDYHYQFHGREVEQPDARG